MEFHVSQENICINETVFNGVLEQSVELDYMLPDYCPNIFKVLKSSIDTKIISQRINGTKLIIDGVAMIKLLYISEETNKLRQLEQKQAFTKTVELKEDCTGGYVSLSAKCDYVNCRAVNSRRLDIHGAVSMKTVVVKPKPMSLVSDCNGLQLHKQDTSFCQNKLCTIKDFTVKENLEIGHGKPPVQDILNYEATAVAQDYKLLANKIICKGQILLHTLYLCSESPDKPEVIEHSVPISQIIDLEGIDEDFQCCITFEVVKYDIDMQIEDDGECRAFIAELGIRAVCEAARNRTVSLVDDCYSTCFETENTTEKIRLERMNRVIQENTMVKKSVSLNQNELSSIYDVMHNISGISWTQEANSIQVMCNLSLSVLAVDMENLPICIDQSIPCEFTLETGPLDRECMFDPKVQVASIAYNIATMEELELRVELVVSGILYDFIFSDVITQVDVDTEQAKSRNDNCSLRLYFADAGESIWEIAKKYNTSVTAILEQNSIEKEVVSSRGMILIPIVD